jgi:hypothetical protein
MLLREINGIYCEKHTNHIRTLCQNAKITYVTAGGIRIQSVTGGMYKTSGEFSLGQTIPI